MLQLPFSFQAPVGADGSRDTYADNAVEAVFKGLEKCYIRKHLPQTTNIKHSRCHSEVKIPFGQSHSLISTNHETSQVLSRLVSFFRVSSEHFSFKEFKILPIMLISAGVHPASVVRWVFSEIATPIDRTILTKHLSSAALFDVQGVRVTQCACDVNGVILILNMSRSFWSHSEF